MQFRPYGDTGRVLSCLGVEISNNIKTQNQYNAILKKSLQRGINYIQYDYRVFRKSIDLKSGLEKAKQGNPIDIGIVVPSNVLKIKKIIKKTINHLGISSIDFIIVQGGISDHIFIKNILSIIKKDNRVRHVIATVNEVDKEIDKLEVTEGLDGIRFTGDAVIKALHEDYSYNPQKGLSISNIFSGDKYKAQNSLIFIAKALSISDINIVTHKFINDKEVDFVIDFIEKEGELDSLELTDEEILNHVQKVEFYEVLKEQKSFFKKIKSIFRKKWRLLDV